MDSLAAKGTRFNKAYSTQPLCLPCRSSLQTGRYPHEIGTITNGHEIKGKFPMLGQLVKDAGYECAYFGKWHVGLPFKNAGYEGGDCGKDPAKTASAVEFLKRKHEKPFFLTVSFMNPHNICELAREPGRQNLPDGPIDKPPEDLDMLPPLPDNFAIPPNEPTAIRKVQKSSWVHYPTAEWDELKWRQYLWGYYRLVEKVDKHIGEVLAALQNAGHEKNTVIIFVSDHGEGVAMHHWNQKQILYDQATRIPAIISWPGRTKGQVSEELISPALDILPTILDVAGAAKPDSMPGLSLWPLTTGKSQKLDRDYVIAETIFAQGRKSLGLRGRMIRTRQYKYCVYDVGKNREQLFDMASDPGEMKNLAVVTAYRKELNRHRKLLADWASDTKDEGFPFVPAQKD